jgi:hypothetical protein
MDETCTTNASPFKHGSSVNSLNRESVLSGKLLSRLANLPFCNFVSFLELVMRKIVSGFAAHYFIRT